MKVVNMIKTSLLLLVTVSCVAIATATLSSPIHQGEASFSRFLVDQNSTTVATNTTTPTDNTTNETEPAAAAAEEEEEGLGCLCLGGPDGPVSNCFDAEDLEHCTCSSGSVVCEEDHADHEDGDDEDPHKAEEGAPFGCHCHEGALHCDVSINPSAYDVCECHSHVHDGMTEIEVECQTIDESCHCEGADELHCSTADQELVADALMCHCHDGLIDCESGLEAEHHEDGEDHDPDHDHDNDTDTAATTSSSLFVDSSCHCDADEMHCSTSEQEMSAAEFCHCHDGRLECEEGITVGDESASSDDDKPWAEVIVTCLLVNLATVAGALIVAGQWLNKVFCKSKLSPSTVRQWRGNIMPMFACGAILGAVFFLVLPESFLLIRENFTDGHEDHGRRMMQEDDENNPETQTTWRWGTSIIGGFVLPVLAHSLFPHSHDHDDHHGHHDHDDHHGHHDHDDDDSSHHGKVDQTMRVDDTMHLSAVQPVDAAASTTNDSSNDDDRAGQAKEEHGDKNVDQDADSSDKLSDPESAEKTGEATVSDTSDADGAPSTKAEPKYNFTMLASLTIGDFFHQFADGIFIGTAWLLCSREVAIAIAIATFVHCFPHQLAEHVMMTSRGGLSDFQAIALNFTTGLSLLLGGVVVLAAEPSPLAIGVILSIGGGVLLHVANAECLNTADRNCTRPIHKLWGFLGFCVGVIPIGLVLLNHEHCHAH